MTANEIVHGIENGFNWRGITVNPFKVKDYDLAMSCLSCLTIMQQSLTMELAVLPYLRMLHQTQEYLSRLYIIILKSFDVSEKQVTFATNEKGKVTWYISLHKDKNGDYTAIDTNVIDIAVKTKATDTLKDFHIHTITEGNFQSLRELICTINEQEVPDEKVDLELWLDKQKENQKAAKKLSYDFKELLFCCARITGRRLPEVQEMTLWEFFNTINSYDTELKFKLYNDPGFTWKGDNPYLDWKYSTINDNPYGLVGIGDLEKQFGGVAEFNIKK